MFVINFKLNFKKILLICLFVSVVTAVFIEYFANNSTLSTSSKVVDKYDYILTEENFTTVLKQIHENIQESLGKTIKMSGFVYKQDDFNKNTFVCGRNIIINEEDNVAGFLCSFKDTDKLKDSEWIEITGIIEQTSYNGSMPIINIGNITKITAPPNTFVK
jgi:putative membrane protein